MKDFPDEGVCMAGILGPLKVDDILFIAAKSNRIAPLQVVRSDRVVGAEHVRSAGMHALRAQKEGRMQAKTLEVEFVRYLAGERQIKNAIEKMGIEDDVAGGIAVALGPKRLDAMQHFVHALAAKEDDGLWESSESKLTNFGVTQTAKDATTKGRRMDLVLEAVASVDLMK
jgi:KEOPS complex subunit Cgi121